MVLESYSQHFGATEHNDVIGTISNLESEILHSEVKSAERETLKKEMAEFIDTFFTKNGFEKGEDFRKELDKYSQDLQLLVRRETPENILKLVQAHQPIDLHFEDISHGEPYPNAAPFNHGLGLREVYTRGFGKINTGSVVFVIGFEPNEKMNVQFPTENFRYYQDAVNKVRMVSGEVGLEDIKFVLVRYARNSFPEDLLTPDEMDHEELKHITRLYTYSQKLN